MTTQDTLVQESQSIATSPPESWKTGYSAAQKRREEYLEWLLTPEAERVPSTKVKLAEQLGISTETLRNYQSDPWFQREYALRGRSLLRVERAGTILDSLYTQAKDPDNPRSVQAAKVLLDWMSKSLDATVTEGDIVDLSDEELENALLTVRKSRESSK